VWVAPCCFQTQEPLRILIPTRFAGRNRACQLFPGFFSQPDTSDLNTDRHAMFSDSCDGDKFKAISTVNVCYIEQLSTSRWFVLQCDCNGFSNVEIKVKFSEDYKINGGVVDPRKKTFNIVIDPATQSGGFCT
jgi:hypothetical protein